MGAVASSTTDVYVVRNLWAVLIATLLVVLVAGTALWAIAGSWGGMGSWGMGSGPVPGGGDMWTLGAMMVALLIVVLALFVLALLRSPSHSPEPSG